MEGAQISTAASSGLKQGRLIQINSKFFALIVLVVSTKTTSVVDTEDILNLTKNLAQSTLGEAYELIDTVEAIPVLIDNLMGVPTTPPSLYIDLEGVNLCREGSISIVQIYIAPQKKTYLIDIFTLGSKAFDTTGKQDCSLKSVLESESIPKVFFDVRNDSDALFSHFQIFLAGIVDLQVMEYGTRTFARKFVRGLAKCIETDLSLSYSQRMECQRVKERGVKLFSPGKGGSYEVFNVRPLSADIGLYCVQDVQWLPNLYQAYFQKLSKTMSAKVARATLDRVKESQSPLYVPNGRHKAHGPW
jgi:exonuclease 3'-5' domain-containing protein 1